MMSAQLATKRTSSGARKTVYTGTQVAPTLKAHAWRDAKNGDYAAIIEVINKGVSSTAMVSLPGGITREEATSVAAYIWSVNNRKVKP